VCWVTVTAVYTSSAVPPLTKADYQGNLAHGLGDLDRFAVER
jgi:hypothetical protein